MLRKLKKSRSNNEGFTIIEVMIVLAIAGLILLIVFLAVPALQRTARNTQRKNDAAAVAAAIADYISNNAGTVPNSKTTVSGDPNSVALCNAATVGGTCVGNTEPAKLGFYTPAEVTFMNPASATWPSTATLTTNALIVDEGYTCPVTPGQALTANSRSAAVIYELEPAILACTEQ